MSASYIGDLVNNHAMTDVVGRNAACAIYILDHFGAFEGALEVAVCDYYQCYV